MNAPVVSQKRQQQSMLTVITTLHDRDTGKRSPAVTIKGPQQDGGKGRKRERDEEGRSHRSAGCMPLPPNVHDIFHRRYLHLADAS